MFSAWNTTTDRSYRASVDKLDNPEVPDVDWCRDFGSFKLAGEGAIPKTFLIKAAAMQSNADNARIAEYSIAVWIDGTL